MLDGLVKKEYSINIDGKEVKYKQLTIMECLEFNLYSKQKDFDLLEWLNKLFKEKLSYKNIDLKKLMKEIYSSAFQGFYKEKKEGELKEISKMQEVKSNFEYLAYLVSVSGQINIDPISILEKYTPEQLTLIRSGLNYKINEENTKGKNKNKIIIEQESTDNTERERILKMVEKLDKNNT